MLDGAPGVVPIDDPHLGHHLGLWRPIPLAWATAEKEPDLTTLRELKRDREGYFFSDRYREAWMPALRDLIRRRFEAQAETTSTERDREPFVVVKEPGSQAAELLAGLFPRSGLVFLLRDGRDVVDSWLDAYGESSWALEEGAYPLSPEGRLPFVRWQAAVWLYRTEAVQRAFAAHHPDRRVLVRYEDLRRDPVPELERICETLGIDADRDRLERAAARQDYDRVPRAAKGNGQEIRSARPGSWRHNLTPAERAAVHEIIGAKLTELGYPPKRAPEPALTR